jgi:hypothetical protein
MNRVIVFALLFGLIFGLSGVFAQDITDLPEPALIQTADNAADAPLYRSGAGLWLPDFEEVVHYLWNFDELYPPEMVRAMEYLSMAALAQAASSDAAIPGSIRNNQYFIQSVQYTNMAQSSFEEGDYDASSRYSEEAIRFAQLSDEYVARQLKIKETDDAIAAAAARIAWASSAAVNAQTRYASEYSSAQNNYNQAVSSRRAEQWDVAIAYANAVISSLAYVSEIEAQTPVQAAPVPVPVGPSQLPAQYTVRAWNISKDCLWNIAGRPWAYGDSRQWKLLYNANRSRLPQPDNPDLIHPGMVLDIPSIEGETRQGMWDSAANYTPLK